MGKVCVLSILSLFLYQFSVAQCEISGQVLYGNPPGKGVGVTIRELETKTGVLSDSRGFFSYSSLSDEKFTIEFSYEGMEPVQYVFDGSKYSSYNLKVSLVPKAKAFQKQKKSYVIVKGKIKKPIPPVDTKAPLISISDIEENSQISFSNSQFEINGNITDNAGIKEVFINETKLNLDINGNFNHIINLEKGINIINIKGIDVNNNKSLFTFNVNQQKPVISKSKRAALIIGNANYQSKTLINTINDAKDLSQKLQLLGFELFKYENIETKSELENTIINFSNKVINYDMVLFYYSGHGVQVDGENFMVPTKAILNSSQVVKNYCVDISTVLNELTGSQCKYKVVILDACRDNPFEKNWAARSQKSYNSGLASMSNSSNTLIMFATSPGSVASDNHVGRNGLFTQELLKNLDKDLTLDQIFKLTGKSVSDISGNCQVPWISSSLFEDIYLKR
jgi:hypothetical protein